jgi:cell division protein FtsN
MVTSRDGNYYGEASTFIYVMDTSSVGTLEDLISSNIKITIPKLNRGTPTNVEVSYSGTIPNPMVMVTIFPGEVSVDTNLMDFDSPWGAWVGPEDNYLTQSNGAYTGSFTIPSFYTGNTFTIFVVVENLDAYMGSMESILYSDFVKINMVVLNIGDSVKDGGIGGKDEPKPQPSEIDSDGDGFTDAEEKGFGTDPDDTYEFPGSEEGDVYKEKKVESADVKVLAETVGEVTIEGIAPVNAPDIPEEIGQSLGIFINITADENATNIKIVIYLGEVGGDIIPANSDPKGIKLFYYDEDTKQWLEVKGSSYNKNTGLLIATIDHLTVFSAMSTKTSEKDGDGDDAGMQNIIIIVVVIIIIVILLGVFGVIAKRKGKGKDPEPGRTEERVAPESEPKPDEEHVLKDEDELEPRKKHEEEPIEKPTEEPQKEIEDVPAEEPSEKEPSEEEPEIPKPPKIVKPGSEAEEQKTSEPEPEMPEEPETATEPEPTEPEHEEPEEEKVEEKEAEPVQQVPCPTCGKDIAVYSSPCSNCGQHLNW